MRGKAGSWLLVLLCSAQFILVVDTTIVVVSLPSIARDLHFSQENLQWIVTVYGLTFGGFLMVGGRGADLFGRRRFFIAGLMVFLAASLVCAFSRTQAMLLIARAVQGLGAAMASPAALSLLTSAYVEGGARNRALGIWSAVGQGGSVTGNIMGGVLSSTIGWRWIFLVNVPICLLAIAGARVMIEKTPRVPRQFVDLPGAISVTLGLGLLILAFSEVEEHGFTSIQSVASFVGAALFLFGFWVVERRVSRPLVPPGLVKGRVAIGNLLIILSGPIVMGAYIFMSLYQQNVLGDSAIHAGFAFVPWAVLVGMTSIIVSRQIARLGVRVLTPLGYAVTGVGLLLMMRIGPAGAYWNVLFPAFFVIGIGGGITGVSNTVVAMSGVERKDQGVAAGIFNSSQRVGSAIGVALLVTVATGHTNALLADHVGTKAAAIAGYRAGMYVSLAFAVIAGLIALWLLPRFAPGRSGEGVGESALIAARPGEHLAS